MINYYMMHACSNRIMKFYFSWRTTSGHWASGHSCSWTPAHIGFSTTRFVYSIDKRWNYCGISLKWGHYFYGLSILFDWSFGCTCTCNIMGSLGCIMNKLFILNVGLWVRGTHEIHKNWASTLFLRILQYCNTCISNQCILYVLS